MSVAITGLGAITGAGTTTHDLENLLRAGESVVRPMLDHDGLPASRVNEIPFARIARRLDRSGKLFIAAALDAWSHAGLDEATISPDRIGLIEGTSLGPTSELISTEKERQLSGRPDYVSPSFLIRFMPGAAAAAFSIDKAIQGPVFTVSAGSAASSYAMVLGYSLIVSGQLDVVVVGGSECPLQRDVLASFAAARILAPKEDRCRPFDSRRQGTVLGEGGGALVLESVDCAARRGVHSLGFLSGVGWATSTQTMTAPDPDGLGHMRAAQAALKQASRPEVDWVVTHGSGTQINDPTEITALRKVFGDAFSRIPLTALKPTIGHCLGACGAIETIGTLLALNAGFIPRVYGLRDVEPGFLPCDIVKDVRHGPFSSAMLMSQSFGGRCCALVIDRNR